MSQLQVSDCSLVLSDFCIIGLQVLKYLLHSVQVELMDAPLDEALFLELFL
jgi:hypothetical protein